MKPATKNHHQKQYHPKVGFAQSLAALYAKTILQHSPTNLKLGRFNSEAQRGTRRYILLKPRRVAFKLELEWPYNRNAGIFAGAQQYAQEQGWESTIC
jgi:hypothetical protein